MLLQTFRVLARCTQTYQTFRISANVNWQTNLARQYSSKFRAREPAAVVNEDELYEVEDDDELKKKIARRDHRQRLRMKQRKAKVEKKETVTIDQPEKKIFTKVHDNEEYLT